MHYLMIHCLMHYFWFAFFLVCIILPDPYVPYTIEISAATHAGEGDVNTIIQFTKEGSELVHILRPKMSLVLTLMNQSSLRIYW